MSIDKPYIRFIEFYVDFCFIAMKIIRFFSAVECRPLSSATCILRSATQIDGVAWWEKFAHNNIIQIWPRQTLYMQIVFVYSIV